MTAGDQATPAAGAAPSDIDAVMSTLRSIVAEVTGLPPEMIEDTSRFDGDLALDSLSFVTVQVEIEATFEIGCSLDELREVEPRFDAVAQLVARKLREGGR